MKTQTIGKTSIASLDTPAWAFKGVRAYAISTKISRTDLFYLCVFISLSLMYLFTNATEDTNKKIINKNKHQIRLVVICT